MKDKKIDKNIEEFIDPIHIPICFCIDLSKSMLTLADSTGAVKTSHLQVLEGKTCDVFDGGVTRLDVLNECLSHLSTVAKHFDYSGYIMDLAFVGFNEKALILKDFNYTEFGGLKQIKPEQLGDSSNLDDGVNKTLDLLNGRKEQYKRAGRVYHHPSLIIISDGDIDSDCTESQKRVIALEGELKINVFLFLVNNGDRKAKKVLRGYSERQEVMNLDLKEFNSFLNYMFSDLIMSEDAPKPSAEKVDLTDDIFFDIDL